MRWMVVVVLLVSCAAEPDAEPEPVVEPEPVAMRELVINEVVAAGDPTDWFEIVNVSDAAIDLHAYVFVDLEGDFVRARRFPENTLGPRERYVQEVSRETVGFALGKSDGLWIYAFEDRRPIDAVSWTDGASPKGGSYARTPDIVGAFTTVEIASR